MTTNIEQDKTRETRLRHAAQRQGYRLEKSRRRDVNAIGYGTFMIVDVATNGLVAAGLPNGYGLTLDDVERELSHR